MQNKVEKLRETNRKAERGEKREKKVKDPIKRLTAES